MHAHQNHTHKLLERNDCILVLIDVQEKLMPVISDKESVTQNILRLVRFAALTGIPVVVTEQEKLGATLAEIKKELPSIGAVPKTHFNCFAGDGFHEALSATGRKTLVLTGAEAHICVLQTAIDGLFRGYNIHIVTDASSSRTAGNREAAFVRMRQAGATLTTTEMFIYEILQKAGTEEFRAVLPMVK